MSAINHTFTKWYHIFTIKLHLKINELHCKSLCLQN